MAYYPELANADLTPAKEDATNNTKALQAPWSRSMFNVWCETELILEIHHFGGVQRIMEGKLWHKIVCIL